MDNLSITEFIEKISFCIFHQILGLREYLAYLSYFKINYL